MAKDYAVKFYTGRVWERCRDSYIADRMAVDGGLCEQCHDEMGLIVHHIKHINDTNIDDPDVTLSENNLMYLCQNCHNKIHGKNFEDEKFYFDSSGMICPIPPLKTD